jgi:hypothetical protein
MNETAYGKIKDGYTMKVTYKVMHNIYLNMITTKNRAFELI